MNKRILVAIASLVAVIVIAAMFATMSLDDKPSRPPSVPLEVELIAGEGEVDLSWDAPLMNGTSDVIGYNIYLYTAVDADQYLEKRTTPEDYFLWTELEGDMQYFFAVSASNKDGEGPRTNLLPIETLTIIVVPNAMDLILDAEEIGVEYVLDYVDLTWPSEMQDIEPRSHVVIDYLFNTTEPLYGWRFVTIEVDVYAFPEEAMELVNSSMPMDPLTYEDVGLGDGSMFGRPETSLFEGWFRYGAIVVYMVFDSSTIYDLPTQSWFIDLMEEQLNKVITGSVV